MKHYNATAKLHIRVNAHTEEEAHAIAKQTIDQALYEYATNRNTSKAVERISKARVQWIKEESPVNRKHNTSGHRGIYWSKRDKKWTVQATVQGKRVYLGRFTNKEEAIKAYQDHAASVRSDYII